MIDGQPTFEVQLDLILAECKMGGGLKVLSPDEYNTEQQRAWWKGVFLPAVADCTGDSEQYWEAKLKLEVLPDEFAPFYIPLGKQVSPVIPSITILSKNKMSKLIKGSIQHLREDPKYGDTFQWVTEPDITKKKKEVTPQDTPQERKE